VILQSVMPMERGNSFLTSRMKTFPVSKRSKTPGLISKRIKARLNLHIRICKPVKISLLKSSPKNKDATILPNQSFPVQTTPLGGSPDC
jgi:hypothetical protein